MLIRGGTRKECNFWLEGRLGFPEIFSSSWWVQWCPLSGAAHCFYTLPKCCLAVNTVRQWSILCRPGWERDRSPRTGCSPKPIEWSVQWRSLNRRKYCHTNSHSCWFHRTRRWWHLLLKTFQQILLDPIISVKLSSTVLQVTIKSSKRKVVTNIEIVFS